MKVYIEQGDDLDAREWEVDAADFVALLPVVRVNKISDSNGNRLVFDELLFDVDGTFYISTVDE